MYKILTKKGSVAFMKCDIVCVSLTRQTFSRFNCIQVDLKDGKIITAQVIKSNSYYHIDNIERIMVLNKK